MNTKIPSLLTAIVCGLMLHPASARAQGSLTPPAGAPAPTMITLAQIEPRTPISSLPCIISQPGSYYLTTNLAGTVGITIATNDVTLDLNGFTLLGAPGTASGIWMPSTQTNLAVRNGVLDSWGSFGVNASNGCNCQFERLRISNISNGSGIQGGNNCLIKDVTSSGNFRHGIWVGANSTIVSCTAGGNAGYGILGGTNCTVRDCTVGGNNAGIVVGDNCTVEDCTASGNSYNVGGGFGNDGIAVGGNNCTVKNCTASGNGPNGLAGLGIDVVGNNNLIIGNNSSGNGLGINIAGKQNRIDGNCCGNNDGAGIYPVSANAGNLIIRNSAPGNVLGGYSNYSGNSDYAPIQTPATATSPWANF